MRGRGDADMLFKLAGHTARRLDALIALLIEKRVLTAGEWEAYTAGPGGGRTTNHKRRRRWPPSE